MPRLKYEFCFQFLEDKWFLDVKAAFLYGFLLELRIKKNLNPVKSEKQA